MEWWDWRGAYEPVRATLPRQGRRLRQQPGRAPHYYGRLLTGPDVDVLGSRSLYQGYIAEISVTATPPTNLLLTLSGASTGISGFPLPIHFNPLGDARYAAVVRARTWAKNNRGGVVATGFSIPIPSGSIVRADGVVAVSGLPIDDSQSGLPLQPRFALSRAGDVYAQPNPRRFGSLSLNPADYAIADRLSPTELFWMPQSLNITETVHSLPDPIIDSTIEALAPSSGRISRNMLIWHASDSIYPLFSATSHTTEHQRNRSEFFSGVALATAAAALLGLIQEAPEAWPWRRRWQKGRKQRDGHTSATQTPAPVKTAVVPDAGDNPRAATDAMRPAAPPRSGFYSGVAAGLFAGALVRRLLRPGDGEELGRRR